MGRVSKIKIVATLGPASSSETVLRKMIFSGLDVVRLNFSHGSFDAHLERVNLIRNLNKKYHRAIKIMQDLEGYRIRVGKLKKPLELRKRQVFYLSKEKIKKERFIPIDYQGSLASIKKGQFIYIDDARLILKVAETTKETLKAEVVLGGVISSHKGINIPGFNIDYQGLTPKDKTSLEFAFKFKPDFIAQSFVREAGDILILKDFIRDKLPDCKVIAKIENKMALRNIDEIIEVSDLVMVARGDLGVCLPFYQVPFIQKEIIRKAKKRRKEVIVATQMLESMTENFFPTRAEVSDVVNAILDGAGFLLLSGETAVGENPPRVVEVMNKIINYTLSYLRPSPNLGKS
ncbi:MAG TPA: pyruvate kinase [Candidatus Omnitrophica bacterium]|nr:MAG: pyruvate kinase [Candidatus Omnitrophota bacterium]RKY43987.1 MAG: pyruvate kinase [Candidatus Omnitrophota bacterium]HEC69567.1 pyruvate kinase [Candidatus Omnitrophota bacterium]